MGGGGDGEELGVRVWKRAMERRRRERERELHWVVVAMAIGDRKKLLVFFLLLHWRESMEQRNETGIHSKLERERFKVMVLLVTCLC